MLELNTNKATWKHRIDIMNAWLLADKTIEFKDKNSDIGWRELPKTAYMNWRWDVSDYRTKPEPKYRPYKNGLEALSSLGKVMRLKLGVVD